MRHFWPFWAPPRIRGPRGPPGDPAPVAEGAPGGPVGGEDPPEGVSGCPPGNPVWKALGRRRRPSGRSDSTHRRSSGEPPWG